MTATTTEQTDPGPLGANTPRAPLPSVAAEVFNIPAAPNPGRVRRFGRQELQQILEVLAAEGIEPTTELTRALALDTETARALSVVPRAPADWLAALSEEDLTGEQLADRMRDHALRELAVGHGSHIAREVLAALLQRAVDALGADLDRIIGELRPKWDPAAADLAAAVKAGITAETTAEDAIAGGDTMCAAWRKIDPAAAELDRLHLLIGRMLFTCGYHLGAQEGTRRGRTAWLAASATGPVPLRPVVGRTTPDDRPHRVGHQRSAVAAEIGAEAIAKTVAEHAQREAFRRAELQAQHDADLAEVVEEPGSPQAEGTHVRPLVESARPGGQS